MLFSYYRTIFPLLIVMIASGVTAETRPPAPISVAQPDVTTLAPAYTFTGSITVRRQALLSPRISGLVKVADVEAGDVVETGQVLIELDPTLAEIELSLRESDLSLAIAEEDEAQRLVDEANQLGDSGFPRSNRLSRETDLEQAKLTVVRVKAEVEAEKEIVRRHQIIAPFHGVVGRRLSEIGEWVETGDPVVQLVGDEDYRLEVRVPQERIREALQTQTVEIRLPGLPDETITGKVDGLGPSVDSGTRTFLVRIKIDNPPDILKPGMSAVALFQPESGESAILVPRDAIIRTGEGQTSVWLVRETEEGLEAHSQVVELGASQGNRIKVLSGLKGDEQVVTRGNESLREGQSVRLVDPPPAAGAESR